MILLRIIFHVDMTNYRYSEDVAGVDVYVTDLARNKENVDEPIFIPQLERGDKHNKQKKSKATEKSE